MSKKTNPPVEIIQDPVLNLIDIDAACAELCKKDFTFFIKEFWSEVVKTPLVWNWHMDQLAKDLEEIAFNLLQGKPKIDYLANLPPGSSKTSICSILYPVWLWTLTPELVIITVSYSDAIALPNSAKSRDILQSEKFKKYFPYVKLRNDSNSLGHYKNTDGGERITTSTMGSLTGAHANIIICDDLQSAKKASSPIEREAVNTWLSETLPTRKISLEKTPVLTIQQRLHPMDVSGFLQSKGVKLRRLCVPAELDKSLFPIELQKYYKGGLYFPERFPRHVLAELKEEMGSRAYNTQLLMNPSSDDDSKIKETWLKVIPDVEFQEIKKGKNIVLSFYADTGIGDKKKNDPSAILCCTKIDQILYIIAVSTVKLEFTKLIKYIESFVSENGGTTQSKIYVEPKATGPAIVDAMKNSALNVIKGADPRDSKETRLEAIVPTLEAGKVILVDNGKWNIEKFLSEVTATNPINDDQRDVLVASVTAEIINKPANYGNYSWNRSK